MCVVCKQFWTAVIAGALVFAAGQAYALSLWASDSQFGSSSKLYELDPATGDVLSELNGPGVFADALSFSNDGQSIYVLDSSVAGNYGKISDIFQIDLDGAVLSQFTVDLDAEGLTILSDGTLVVGGGSSGVVAFVDPIAQQIQSRFRVRKDLFGLSSDGLGNIFGLTTNGIIETYSLSGTLLDSLATDATGFTLGLAYTGDSFFISSRTNEIFEIDPGEGLVLNSYSSPGPFTEGLDFPSIQAAPVPEPSTVLLVGLGMAAVGLATGCKKFLTKHRPSSRVQG